MVCPTCKREVSNDSNICPFCNTPLSLEMPAIGQKLAPNIPNNSNSNNGFFEIIDKEDLDQEKMVQIPNNTINQEFSTLRNTTNNSNDLSINEVNQIGDNINRENNDLNGNILEPVVKKVIVNTNLSNDEKIPVLEKINNNIENSIEKTEAKDEIIKEKKDEKKTNNFLIGIIAIGIITLVVILIFMLFMLSKSDSKNNIPSTRIKTKYVPPTEMAVITNNKGRKSTYNYPLQIGNISLASIYDTVGDTYYEVDVTGIRFIDNLEASELASIYANTHSTNGFSWYGFEYKVQFNDLQALNGRKINPVLNAKVYTFDGNDFVTYEGHNYLLEVKTLSNNVMMITNNESTTIKVIYQVLSNQNDYSICFGYRDKTMGCFAKS